MRNSGLGARRNDGERSRRDDSQSQQQPGAKAAPAEGPRFDERRISGVFGPIAVGGALILALATFVTFAGFTPIIPTPGVVLICSAATG